MILSDRDIKLRQETEGLISPFTEENLQPASYDLTLAGEAWKQKIYSTFYINIQEPPSMDKKTGEFFTFTELRIFPGDFLLCSTREKITVPVDMCARMEGKSSLGRLGLMVHVTAGFIDPGFRGHLTLELHHVGKIPLIITPKERVSQITFYNLTSPAERGYGDKTLKSKYQDQGKKPVPYA